MNDPADVAERFWSRVDKTGDCWLWTGTKSNGYGRCSYKGQVMGAHRVAFFLAGKRIPKGWELDHRCHNSDKTCPGGDTCLHRACVRPDHLQAVTHTANSLRGFGRSNIVAANFSYMRSGNPEKRLRYLEREQARREARKTGRLP